MLGLLGGLHEPFYRQKLIPSIAALKEITPATVESVPPQGATTVEQEPELIKRLDKLQGEQLIKIQDWCNSVKHLMFPSVSQYTDGRMELHLRRFVSLISAKSFKKAEVKMVDPSMYTGCAEIEALGEKLLPEFHQALVLFYPAGTQIKVHRDSPAYAPGAAQINVTGRARFSISGCQDVRRMESYWLNEGAVLHSTISSRMELKEWRANDGVFVFSS
ncbi:hypothetical protein [Nostoc sp. MG11]|uniref:hypothetical protein n=1 Tax=Nostoc sp. MG11 TaxID=2721166 RepID=UPI001D003D79|nr:hypothetical protein [Nostoc sp. MG11]